MITPEDPPPGSWTCHECDDTTIPSGKLIDHIRLFHDPDNIPETWPDGGPVFYEWD